MQKTAMNFKIVSVIVFMGVMAGCAKSPESIQASYISPTTYTGWSCKQLASEAARIDSAYSQAAQQQKNARTNDIVGVVLIGLPVSSLSGDNISGQIADLKGRKATLEQAQTRKNCLK